LRSFSLAAENESRSDVRILVYEFASGGGLAGRHVPASLAREGSAMRAALVADLHAIGQHEIVTTADARVGRDVPRGVDVVALPAGDRARETALDRLIGGADAVWLVAPETDRCLERLAARVERQRTPLLGSSVDAIRRASDKARLPHWLASVGVRHPQTRALARDGDPRRAADQIGYPIVVKPARGAGSHGIRLARNARELARAIDLARRSTDSGRVLVQEYVRGVAASVSLLANGRGAVALTLNAQEIGSRPTFAYRGGETPFDHPLASRAIASALDTCRALPGLRGFLGIDLLLTESEVVVIEVNPRLTTAYLGVRAALDENIAAWALGACAGNLPAAPRARQRVRFTASGRVAVIGSAPAERGAA
jgi:tyramine---L-glutamate ligase